MEFTDKITNVKRLNNSRNGNARYHIATKSGFMSVTKSDADFAIGKDLTHLKGQKATIHVGFTRLGKAIITGLEVQS